MTLDLTLMQWILYDAMGVYLDGASTVDGQKILVAYTDGGDTRSSLNAGELSDLLKACREMGGFVEQ